MHRRFVLRAIAGGLGQTQRGLLLAGLLLLAASGCAPSAPVQAIPPTIATTPPPLAETPQIRRITPRPSASNTPLPSATPVDGSPQPTASPTSPVEPGQEVSEIDGARLVRVGGGPFWMGSAESEVLTGPEIPAGRIRHPGL